MGFTHFLGITSGHCCFNSAARRSTDDCLLSRWWGVLNSRAALVRHCLQTAILTPQQVQTLLKAGFGSSSLATLSAGCPGTSFPPEDVDSLISKNPLHCEPAAVRADAQLLKAYRTVVVLLKGLAKDAERDVHRKSGSRRGSRSSRSAYLSTDREERACDSSGQSPCELPPPEGFEKLLGMLRELLTSLDAPIRLQVLEVVFAALFLRISDVDSCADDPLSSDAETPPREPQPHSTTAHARTSRLLLSVHVQAKLSDLIAKELETIGDDLEEDGEGKQESRWKSLASRLERHRRRLRAASPLATGGDITHLMTSSPEGLLALCWERGWLRHARTVCETFPECDSRLFVRLRGELGLTEELECTRISLETMTGGESTDAERTIGQELSVREKIGGSGMIASRDVGQSRSSGGQSRSSGEQSTVSEDAARENPVYERKQASVAESEREPAESKQHASASAFEAESDSTRKSPDPDHLCQRIGRLALRALSCDSVLHLLISRVERSGVQLPAAGAHLLCLPSAGHTLLCEMALTSEGSQLLTTVHDQWTSDHSRSSRLASLLTAVHQWLSPPWPGPLPQPSTSPRHVLLSLAPLSPTTAQQSSRRWRRFAELASTATEGEAWVRLAALAHRLDDGNSGGEARPDYLMSLMQYLVQLKKLLTGEDTDSTGDGLVAMETRPSAALAQRALTFDGDLDALAASSTALGLDLDRVVLGRLHPSLDAPARPRRLPQILSNYDQTAEKNGPLLLRSSSSKEWDPDEQIPPCRGRVVQLEESAISERTKVSKAELDCDQDGKYIKSCGDEDDGALSGVRNVEVASEVMPVEEADRENASMTTGDPVFIADGSCKDATSELSVPDTTTMQSSYSTIAAEIDALAHQTSQTRHSPLSTSSSHAHLLSHISEYLHRLPELLEDASGDPPCPQPCPPAVLERLGHRSPLLAQLQRTLAGGSQCRQLKKASLDGASAALACEPMGRARLADLLRNKWWQQALHQAESLCQLPEMSDVRDALLAILALQSDVSESWRLCAAVSDDRLRYTLVAALAENWPLRRALDLTTGLPDPDRLRERLLITHQLFQLWRETSPPTSDSWAYLEQLCITTPSVTARLLAAGDPTLRRRWRHLYGDTNIGGASETVADQLAVLLKVPTEAPVTTVGQLLSEISADEAFILSERLDSASARASLLWGVCRSQSELTPDAYHSLYRRAAAYQLLTLLGNGWLHYRHLAAQPQLIVVQLIVNRHYQMAGRALHLLEDLHLLSSPVLLPRSSPPSQYPPPRFPVPPIDHQVNSCLEQMALRALKVAPPSQQGAAVRLPSAAPRYKWTADEDAQGCERCGAAFETRNRRHHCRRCGKLVCQSCSPHRMQLAGEAGPVRVCQVCRACVPLATTTGAEVDSSSGEHRQRAGEPSWSLPPRYLLTDNADHNRALLDTISLPGAASVSTCLLLLQLHTDAAAAAALLQTAAARLIWRTPAESGSDGSCVDAGDPASPELVLDMARRLALAGKLLWARAERPEPAAQCDALIRAVDVTMLLKKAGCGDLAGAGHLADVAALRRLQATLVSRERWRAALDVSAKAGLDCGPVWAAWGLACLRAGDLPSARSRLERVLKPAGEPDRSGEQRDLLDNIVRVLETTPTSSAGNHDLTLLKAEADIEAIIAGRIPLPPSQPAASSIDESLYYLSRFSGPRACLSLLRRHGMYSRALTVAQELEASPEDFHHALMVQAVRTGQLEALLQALKQSSPTLAKWKDYLQCSCGQLQRAGAWHTLLQLQLSCRDLLRAAATCIRLFCRRGDYPGYAQALHHLEAARDHLSDHLKQTTWQTPPTPGPHLTLQLPWKRVSKQLTTVELQMQLTRYLADPANVYDTVPLLETPAPTLFGSGGQRRRTLQLLLSASRSAQEALCLAQRIDQSLLIGLESALPATAARLVATGRSDHLYRLLSDIQQTAPLSQSALRTLLTLPPPEHPCCTLLLAAITDPAHKFEALLHCRRYKAAYLHAAGRRRPRQVAAVFSAARKDGATAVTALSRHWLSKHSPALLAEAEGNQAKAEGNQAKTEGNQTKAEGNRAKTEGNQAKAQGFE